MSVLYASVGSKVRPRTFGPFSMGSEALYFLSSRLHLYSDGSGVNRVKVVLSGFSLRYTCKTVCMYDYMYFLEALVLVCVYVMVLLSAYDMT